MFGLPNAKEKLELLPFSKKCMTLEGHEGRGEEVGLSTGVRRGQETLCEGPVLSCDLKKLKKYKHTFFLQHTRQMPAYFISSTYHFVCDMMLWMRLQDMMV